MKGQSIGFTTTPYQDQVPAQKNFSKEESNIIQCEINKLLQKEVMKLTSHEPGKFISTMFLRPKPDGTHRMILNLKKLNESVKYEHFKMDTLWTVIRMRKHNCYMASFDSKDAYYSVPIADWAHSNWFLPVVVSLPGFVIVINVFYIRNSQAKQNK